MSRRTNLNQVSPEVYEAVVTLNAAEIQFGEVTITAGGRMQAARVTLDEKNEMATLTVPRALPKGGASIQITRTPGFSMTSCAAFI